MMVDGDVLFMSHGYDTSMAPTLCQTLPHFATPGYDVPMSPTHPSHCMRFGLSSFSKAPSVGPGKRRAADSTRPPDAKRPRAGPRTTHFLSVYFFSPYLYQNDGGR
mmetsp:Transcript_37489/g.66798  ORF Transcript_37489/g.66798 Transcript_37489/m.66798 type:complete len:106 (-) Transcript_37489:240-557(-)